MEYIGYLGNIARKLRELEYEGLIGLEFYPSTTEAKALTAVRRIFSSDRAGVQP